MSNHRGQDVQKIGNACTAVGCAAMIGLVMLAIFVIIVVALIRR